MRPPGLRIRLRRGFGGHVHGALAALLVLAAIALVLTVAHFIAKARAETVHEWIHRTHPACCTGQDCFPVNARKVPAGWIVEWHGEMMPYSGPIAPSPADTWACGTRERIRCLFIEGGIS